MSFSGLKRWFMEHVAPALSEGATTFVHALVHDIETSGGALLRELAVAAVAAAEAPGVSGADKFAAALASVKGGLKTKGVTFIENAVQGAIIAAVADLHATTYIDTGKAN